MPSSILGGCWRCILLAAFFVVFVSAFSAFGPLPSSNSVCRGRSSPPTACRTGSRLGMSLEKEDIEYFEPPGGMDGQYLPSSPKAATRELPLFPLNVVTFPHGKMPLHIFEMRYRQMMNRIGNDDNRFGIILLDGEAQKLGAVGTVVEVVERSLLADGRQLCNNVGRERFRLLKIIQQKPYVIGLVETGIKDEELITAEGKEQLAKLESDVWTTLNEVIRLSNKVNGGERKVSASKEVRMFAPGGLGMGMDGEGAVAEGKDRSESFSYCITEMLDIPYVWKQRMLQTRKTADRLQFQFTLLDKGLKKLAAQASLQALNFSSDPPSSSPPSPPSPSPSSDDQ